MSVRAEADILHELGDLCASEGYVHALAFLAFRDNVILSNSDEFSAKDFERVRSPDRLIGTEFATVLGLAVKQPISFSLPNPRTTQMYIDRTEALLEELHESMRRPAREILWAALKGGDPRKSPFAQGPLLREAMFYGPDSAYDFQFRDLAVRRYRRDDPWLIANRGFSIVDAAEVLRAVCKVQLARFPVVLQEVHKRPPDEWTLLPAFCFTVPEVASASGHERSIVEAVLESFAIPPGERNGGFNSLHDFNVMAARPLLRAEDGSFTLFQQYGLMESLYESPAFWMREDAAYADTATINRGLFTEEFCRERLELVFGRDNVHGNVRIRETKGRTAGEIDVLVIFGNRALVVQAKSKRLTLQARKGNAQLLRDDFKKSVQDAYEQAVQCARKLRDPRLRFENSQSQPVAVPRDLKEVFVLCVVSDHYPALFFQAREFLKWAPEPGIREPFVLDVFALDAISEMLQTPLRFLSYIGRRVGYTDRVIATHELMVLGYHLKKNLWVEDEITALTLDDTVSAGLDVAMAVRREGLPGPRTPDGILTRLASTSVGKIIEQIEASPSPGPLELGFLLLALSEDAVRDLSVVLDRLKQQAVKDGQVHDFTFTFKKPEAGLTIHLSDAQSGEAARRLEAHCLLRKYAQRTSKWIGICLQPRDLSIRFGVLLEFPWSPDPRMDDATRDLRPPTPVQEILHGPTKQPPVGRNAPCPCGSGLKYKKCHLRK